MNRRCFSGPGMLALTAVGALALASLWNCDVDPIVDDIVIPVIYHAPTAPESLVANLQISYRWREIQEYAKILAPEFRFKFQPVDAIRIGKASWSHNEDSTGTAKLFRALEVSEIRIELLHGLSEPASEVNMPPGAMKIRINQTDLQVDEGHITYVVIDRQDMFFRRGLAEAGEDTTRWFLLEWRDLPTLAEIEPRSFAWTGAPTPVGRLTWGWLKARYGN